MTGPGPLLADCLALKVFWRNLPLWELWPRMVVLVGFRGLFLLPRVDRRAGGKPLDGCDVIAS